MLAPLPVSSSPVPPDGQCPHNAWPQLPWGHGASGRPAPPCCHSHPSPPSHHGLRQRSAPRWSWKVLRQEFSRTINQAPQGQAGLRGLVFSTTGKAVPVPVGAARPRGRLSASGWLRPMNLTAGEEEERTTWCSALLPPSAQLPPGAVRWRNLPPAQGHRTRLWRHSPFPSPRSPARAQPQSRTVCPGGRCEARSGCAQQLVQEWGVSTPPGRRAGRG